MQWRMENCPVCKRRSVVELIHSGVAIAEAARQCGMSRTKANKWLARYDEGGQEALEDRSRARSDPGRFEGPLAERLVELRLKYSWGPKKLLQYLSRKGERDLPAASTVGGLLSRRGLVQPRKRRRAHEPFQYAGPVPAEPNARWTMDFKGDFRLGDGALCLPFTLRDAASRKVLSIRAMTSTRAAPVQAELERTFGEHGLPEELQSDNGPPFASSGLCCLSKLSVWLLKLGVVPVLSRPGKPQDNGGHERMHRDLKAETTRPPALDACAQQRKFDAFRRRFNEERPHEALDGDVPEEHWVPSPRSFPRQVPQPEYPAWWETRRVCPSDGTFSWRNQPIDLSEALSGERIALEPVDDGLWRIHFHEFAVGLFDETGSRPIVTSLPRVSGRLPAVPRPPAIPRPGLQVGL
jgi:transposase InsO family protein